MELRHLRIRNFMSVQDAVIDFTGSGLTLVRGKNGAGKSALFVESLLWLLYDSLNRTDEKKFTREVRRWYRGSFVEEPTVVEAWFSRNGVEYYLKRDLKDGWCISAGGSIVTPYRNKADALPVVQEAVGLPENLFRAIAVMGQGFTTRFSAYKDSDRTQVIEDFIGAEAYVEAQGYSSQRNTEISEVLAGLRAARDQAQASLTESQRLLAEGEQQAAAVRRQMAEARQALETEAAGLQHNRTGLVQHLSDLSQQQRTLEVSLKQWEAEERAAGSLVAQRRENSGRIRAEITAAEGSLQVLDSLAETCPTCRGPVNRTVVDRERELLRGQIQRSAGEFNQEQLLLGEAIQQQQAAQQTVTGHRASRDALSGEISGKNLALSGIDQRLGVIQSELSRVQETETLSNTYVQNARERAEKEQMEVDRLTAGVQQYEDLQPYVGWWVEHFSVRGLRSWRLGGVLETMNQPLADCCQKLFDGEILVRMLPVKPQKSGRAKSVASIDVQSPGRSYQMSSGGQSRCIDLALHFAFRRLARNSSHGWGSNFLVADEVFDFVERSVVERALGVLRGEAERVFLITHSPALQGLCDSVWEIGYQDQITFLQPAA